MTTCRSSYTEVLRSTRAYLLLLCVSYSAVNYCMKSQRSAAQMSGVHDAEPMEDIVRGVGTASTVPMDTRLAWANCNDPECGTPGHAGLGKEKKKKDGRRKR